MFSSFQKKMIGPFGSRVGCGQLLFFHLHRNACTNQNEIVGGLEFDTNQVFIDKKISAETF